MRSLKPAAAGGTNDNHGGSRPPRRVRTCVATRLGRSTAAQSGKYGIILGYEGPASINTQVNAYTFTQTSEEGTFPTTGFTGGDVHHRAEKDSKSVTEVRTSDASWVSVTDGGGEVHRNRYAGDKVTITGTPTSSREHH
ncbi:hypothetical protein KCP77_02305 [Salmonella enterica subsp. enterica]|nr:hypothetical protein KCP77_02305 [Salmonella enterica subsp. enterica]